MSRRLIFYLLIDQHRRRVTWRASIKNGIFRYPAQYIIRHPSVLRVACMPRTPRGTRVAVAGPHHLLSSAPFQIHLGTAEAQGDCKWLRSTKPASRSAFPSVAAC
jgi:hypothetical protein